MPVNVSVCRLYGLSMSIITAIRRSLPMPHSWLRRGRRSCLTSLEKCPRSPIAKYSVISSERKRLLWQGEHPIRADPLIGHTPMCTGNSKVAGNVRRGFTVVEMLVVMSIIALMIALLIPTMNRARTLQQRVVCLTNQHQLSSGLVTYISDNSRVYPHSEEAGFAFGDAYDYVRSHPYGGKAIRPWYNLGLLLRTGIIGPQEIVNIGKCPSFDNADNPTAPNHCSDRKFNLGSGDCYGVSQIQNQMDENVQRYRIISSYNYRGVSYYQQRKTPMRASAPGLNEQFVMLADTPDVRFRGVYSAYNKHGGYNRVFGDGSGAFWDDTDFLVDRVIVDGRNSRKTVDGRGVLGSWASNTRAGSLDEAVYTIMAKEQWVDPLDMVKDRLW
ncbi:MAG: prepilin-type N-terminal cleavage/methylation domain-containing protein [Phycisphaera sp.]|nr:prepilin-type N-terminal cleavage/methylation domain-containing protein [Phycisphaera sp.]